MEECELEISINIGMKKYMIKVPNSAHLQQLVSRFLDEHAISQKYQNAIITLIQQKLAEKLKA